MTVKELINFLKKQPQNIQVVYTCYSGQLLLEEGDITITELCLPRNDGWVQNKRPDMKTEKYLLIPGN